MPLNARRLSINMQYNGINKPFRTMKHMVERGKITIKKWVFRA